jgi:branched-chain amino acid transport system substrate-binding protein
VSDVIVGAAASAISFSVIDKVTAAGIVHFSPSNTAALFSSYLDRGLYFRTAPSDTLQARAIANRMADAGAARVGMFARDDLYGASLAESLVTGLQTRGIAADQILLIQYDPGSRHLARDLTDAAATMKAFHPDSISIIAFDETPLIVQALNDLGIGPGR